MANEKIKKIYNLDSSIVALIDELVLLDSPKNGSSERIIELAIYQLAVRHFGSEKVDSIIQKANS